MSFPWFHFKIKLRYMNPDIGKSHLAHFCETLRKSMAAIILGYDCQHGGYTAI